MLNYVINQCIKQRTALKLCILILAETWLSEPDSNTYDIQNFEQIRMDSTIVQSH